MTRLARVAASVPARPVAALVPLIRQELDAGAGHYREAGKLLLEAKTRVKHGQFTPWIAAHFNDLSYSSAKGYMRLAAKGHQGALLRDARSDPATRRKGHTRRESLPRASHDDTDAVRDMAVNVIEAGHRALAIKHHPDKPGGSVDAMTRVNRARTLLLQCLRNG